MNEFRINDLIDRFFNCELDGEDRAALEQALLRSPQARALFWRKAEIHDGLREWGLEHWDRLGRPLAAGRRSFSVTIAFKGLSRAVRAAAIPFTLLVGSMVGMGVAWAIVPQARAVLTLPLRLSNAGFEDEAAGSLLDNATADRLEQLPSRPGVWAADRVRVCEAEEGVTPAEGSRMLAFEQALPGPGDTAGSRADSCDLFQLVDLTMYRPQIARGGCTLTASARVVDAGAVRRVATDFVVRVYVYSGAAGSAAATWPHARLDAIATGSERLTSFGGEADWKELTAQASLPKDASFALLQIDATSMDRSPGRPAALFERHYCDDVRLRLMLPAGTTTSPTPDPSSLLPLGDATR